MDVSRSACFPPLPSTLRRALGLAAGVLVHLLFAVTVWQLFWFLKDGVTSGPEGSLLTNVVLALLFALPHSLLLHPKVRRRLSTWIAPPFYGLFYTVITCVTLLIIFACWRSSGPILWRFTGNARSLIEAAFYASWAALFYSLHLTGLGHQTGLTPWLAWVQRCPAPRREFAPRGLYRYLRHPVYVSFMGLVWFTPTMTLDHAVLTGVWTCYLLIGSWLKDRRLEYYVGDAYREYEARVAGFPLAIVGPLGKLKRPASRGGVELRKAA